jgi:hypothetical protein
VELTSGDLLFVLDSGLGMERSRLTGRQKSRDVGKDLAAETGGSAHGPWRLADSPALHIALPNVYFDSLGIPRLAVCW